MPVELPEVAYQPYPGPDSLWLVLSKVIDKIDIALRDSRLGDRGRIVSLDPTSLGSELSSISVRDILPDNNESNDGNRQRLGGTNGMGTRGWNKTNEQIEQDGNLQEYLDIEHTTLPRFSLDYSEMVMAGMIEREDDSFDLHVTTFFLSHEMLIADETGNSAHNVRNDRETLLSWSKAVVAFRKVIYTESGVRDGPKFYCKISHSDGEASYVVEG